jgi:hypothetical protein
MQFLLKLQMNIQDTCMYLWNKCDDFWKRRCTIFKYYENWKHRCSCARNLLQVHTLIPPSEKPYVAFLPHIQLNVWRRKDNFLKEKLEEEHMELTM